jgi:hypothetical protein
MRSARSLAAILAALAIYACGGSEARKNGNDISAEDLARTGRCHSASGEAKLAQLQSSSVAHSEALQAGKSSVSILLSDRRENERICTALATCLGIKEQYQDLYVRDCLSSAEKSSD